MSSIPDLAHMSPQMIAYFKELPLTPPPHGQKSNFVNPSDRRGLMLGLGGTLMAIALLFLLNRAYVKLQLMRRITWDDGAMIIATVMALALFGIYTYAVLDVGMARHAWDLSTYMVLQRKFLLVEYLTFIWPPITLLFLKSSFFLLYLQLFEQLRWAKIASWIGLVFTISTYISLTGACFALSSPTKGQWADKVVRDVSIPISALGLAVDIYILVIPTIVISRMQLSLPRKIGASLIFLSGLIVCICLIISIYLRWHNGRIIDRIWEAVWLNCLVMAEIFLGIICACLPTAIYGFNHKNSIYQRLIRETASLCSSRDNTQSPRTNLKRSSISNPLKSTDRKYAPYLELNEHSLDGPQSRVESKEGNQPALDFITVPDDTRKSPSIQHQVDVARKIDATEQHLPSSGVDTRHLFPKAFL